MFFEDAFLIFSRYEYMSNPSKHPTTTSVLSAVFMSIEPATRPEDKNSNFLVLSLERNPSEIEQVAFTHEDGKLMLGGLLEALSAQGDPAAKLLLDTLKDAYEQNETEEDEDDEDADEILEDDSETVGDDGDSDDFGHEASS